MKDDITEKDVDVQVKKWVLAMRDLANKFEETAKEEKIKNDKLLELLFVKGQSMLTVDMYQ